MGIRIGVGMRIQVSLFEQPRDHRRSGTNIQLGEDSSQVRTDCPRTDVKHCRNSFVGVSFCDHSRNLSLSRTERGLTAIVPWLEPNKQTSYAVYLFVQDYSWIFGVRPGRSGGMT